MHENLWLVECAVHEQVTNPLPCRFVSRAELDAEMLLTQPIVKKRQLEPQQFFVVRRQRRLVRNAALLHGSQCVQGIVVQRPGRLGLCKELPEVLPGTEIRQQQETVVEIGFENARRIQLHSLEVAGDAYVGSAVLLRRRGVHRNVGLLGRMQSEIATKARVLGSWFRIRRGESFESP